MRRSPALGLPQRIGEAQRAELEAVFQGMDVDDSRGVDFAEFADFMRAKFAATAGPAATATSGDDSAIGAGAGEIAAPKHPEPAQQMSKKEASAQRKAEAKAASAEGIRQARQGRAKAATEPKGGGEGSQEEGRPAQTSAAIMAEPAPAADAQAPQMRRTQR